MGKIKFYIGGSKLSGAEGRMLATASLLKQSQKLEVTVILKESLHQALLLDENKNSLIDKANVKYITIKDTFLGRKNKFFYLIFLIFHNLMLPKRNTINYFVLFDPIYFPCTWFSKKNFFEVTSPDIAKSKMVFRLATIFKNFRFVCVSENVKRILQKRAKDLNVDRIYIRKVPFCGIKPSCNVLKEKIKQVIFAHRMIERKNPIAATQAFLALGKTYQDWSFQIYGSGPLENKVRDIIESNNLTNVKFNGHCLNLKNQLVNSSIFLSLIEPDNYPSQSVLEAAALGNALVVSNTGESREKFINKNGKAIDISPESIIDAISTLINSEDLSKLQMNSIELIENRYRLSHYLNEQISFLDAQENSMGPSWKA